MPGPDVTILLSERDRAYHPDQDPQTYLIGYIIAAWQRKGLNVEVVRGIPPPSRPLGLVVPHIDLTKRPARYEDFLAQCPRVLNLRMRDISKSRISKNLVANRSDFDGPVIVKTDANCGGWPERRLNPKWKKKAMRCVGWRGLGGSGTFVPVPIRFMILPGRSHTLYGGTET